MRAVVLSEYRRFMQTRLWLLLLAAMAAFVGFVALALSFVSTAAASDALQPPVEAARTTYSAVNGAGYVFPLLVGTMLSTTEFRHRTISTSLIAQPRRGRLLLGKLAIAVPVGVLFGVVGQGAAVVAGAPVLAMQGEGPQLTESTVLVGLAMGVVTSTAWTVMGAAFGLAVRNQVAAIVIVLAFNQLVEPIARLALGLVDSLSGFGAFFPGAAADAVIGSSFLGDLVADELLAPWAGLLVMLAYVAVFAAVARAVTLRRDVV